MRSESYTFAAVGKCEKCHDLYRLKPILLLFNLVPLDWMLSFWSKERGQNYGAFLQFLFMTKGAKDETPR